MGFPTEPSAAIGIPLAVWVLWSLFLAPKASMPHIPYQLRTVFKFTVFALASVALYDGGHNTLAMFVLVTSFIDVVIIMMMKLDIRVPKYGLTVSTNSR
ncbi:YrdB family protein [Cohnella cholangitidis]|uniref:YrdB family protein n=1 Tax=Cohnella cholangitidis TaxID=2598458 RepID=UPI0015FD4215|nr:YrdB family protein [Cohnella cholangitidis]